MKALKIPYEEEAMEATIRRRRRSHHFYFQVWRVSQKNTYIIMTFNIGSTTHANSGSNIIGFNFGEKRAWRKIFNLKNDSHKQIEWAFSDVSEWSTIAHKWIPKDDMETNNYKLYCFKNLPLKQKWLQHKGPGSHLEKGTNPEYTCQVKRFNVDPK